MEFKDYLNLVGAVITSVGGASALIFGLSSFLGKAWAARILEKDKDKYSKELEGLKQNYSKELETYKVELEKSKSMYLRYKESQFTLYTEIWKSLCDLKNKGDDLWESVTQDKLVSYVKQLKDTKDTVEKNMLLLEENHYNRLIDLFDKFNEFKVGKKKLLELIEENNIEPNEVNYWDGLGMVTENSRLKNEYTNLMQEISNYFRWQIRGQVN